MSFGTQSPPVGRERMELPTVVLLCCTYLAWAAVTGFAAALGPWLAVPLLALVLAQHSSLQHEVIHGHPTASARLNAALVFPALGLLMPFERFRDLHLAHHFDPALTDPHDDPEFELSRPGGLGRAAPAGPAAAGGQQHPAGPDAAGAAARHLQPVAGRPRGDPGRRAAGGAGVGAAPAGRAAGGALAGGRGQHAGLVVPARLPAGAVDPAHPHLPRAPGPRAGRARAA